MAEATSSDKNTENEKVVNDDPRISNWTKEEKVELYQAIKRFGSENTTVLADQFFDKSQEDVKAALQFYEDQASKVLDLPEQRAAKRKLRRSSSYTSKQANIPLASWAKFLTDSHKYEKLQNEISTALRLIAYFDKQAPSVTTSKIDINKINHMLADAMEGKMIQGDEYIKVILEKCITETALTSKAFINSVTYKQALQNINLNEEVATTFPKPEDNLELNNMRYFIYKENYNPLNISENYLKPSK